MLKLITACNTPLISEKQSEIDNISARLIPDQREGISNITAVKGRAKSIILRGETTNPLVRSEIIKTLGDSGIVLIDSIIILPDTTLNKRCFGVVSLSVLNLRKQPEHSSELVSQAILGTPVLILKNKGSWLLIQTPDKYIAWTESSSIKLMNVRELEEWRKANKIICLENSGWIYSSTDESGVVGDIVAGSILKKTGESKNYIKVTFPDGREGFVRNKAVMDFEKWKNQICCTEENLCAIAATYNGLPYLWGGTSTKGVDCSGFVRSVFFMNGIILSRDASLQARHGLPVDLSDGFSHLRRGDLLFFGSKENSIPHVSHVAIYIGNSEYINSSGRVMINSLDSTQSNYIRYREVSLLSARRIIGTGNDEGIISVRQHEWY